MTKPQDQNSTSKARVAFDKNSEDIRKLLSLHEEQSGVSPGRRRGLEVLNKSAIVLIVAFWEAYCEDIAEEAIIHILKFSENSKNIPNSLKKVIALEIKADKNDLSPWNLADNEWKSYIEKRIAKITTERNRKLNTPKTEQINSLFRESVGIEKISSEWRWQKMSQQSAEKKLNKLIELRGSIAHRGKNSESVKKSTVENYFSFIDNLIGVTGRSVNNYVVSITGKHIF